ncbi:MAG: PAS domain S-box protein [Candidatus Hodarchaeales archaeon]|jgi:PAS domain S-box-containing protein
MMTSECGINGHFENCSHLPTCFAHFCPLVKDEEAADFFKELLSLFPASYPMAVGDTFSPFGKSRILWTTKAFQKLLGYTKEELCLANPRMFLVDLKERDKWLEILVDQGYTENFEVHVKHKTGKKFAVYASGTIIYYMKATYLVVCFCRTLEESKEFNKQKKWGFLADKQG